MKRLLLPLLAALALPTAANPFPWGSDIVVKTDLDEKYVVKKTAVQVVGYSQTLLINSLELQAKKIKENYRKCVSENGDKLNYLTPNTVWGSYWSNNEGGTISPQA